MYESQESDRQTSDARASRGPRRAACPVHPRVVLPLWHPPWELPDRWDMSAPCHSRAVSISLAGLPSNSCAWPRLRHAPSTAWIVTRPLPRPHFARKGPASGPLSVPAQLKWPGTTTTHTTPHVDGTLQNSTQPTLRALLLPGARPLLAAHNQHLLLLPWFSLFPEWTHACAQHTATGAGSWRAGHLTA